MVGWLPGWLTGWLASMLVGNALAARLGQLARVVCKRCCKLDMPLMRCSCLTRAHGLNTDLPTHACSPICMSAVLSVCGGHQGRRQQHTPLQRSHLCDSCSQVSALDSPLAGRRPMKQLPIAAACQHSDKTAHPPYPAMSKEAWAVCVGGCFFGGGSTWWCWELPGRSCTNCPHT